MICILYFFTTADPAVHLPGHNYFLFRLDTSSFNLHAGLAFDETLFDSAFSVLRHHTWKVGNWAEIRTSRHVQVLWARGYLGRMTSERRHAQVSFLRWFVRGVCFPDTSVVHIARESRTATSERDGQRIDELRAVPFPFTQDLQIPCVSGAASQLTASPS